jgi:hypothetical protein
MAPASGQELGGGDDVGGGDLTQMDVVPRPTSEAAGEPGRGSSGRCARRGDDCGARPRCGCAARARHRRPSAGQQREPGPRQAGEGGDPGIVQEPCEIQDLSGSGDAQVPLMQDW